MLPHHYGSIPITLYTMRTLLFILSLFLVRFVANAQTDSILVFVFVTDAFTGEIIEEGEVDVLTTDSTFIRKGKWTYNTDDGVRTASLISCTIHKEGNYIFKLQHPNYFTEYYPINVQISKRNNNVISVPEKIRMRKRPKEIQLGEVVVKATKIKMVVKNDTIVYNADAFQLSQGSMLDALIEQLPGAELKDNGLITVNGRPVSSLLVNGKDFFKGDPKIALENLPAYMVDKVKVYERQTEFEEMTGLKESLRPLVMDVNLKRQYSIGWIANAEAAYGTEDKYLGRLFAMRFTDCSRLALFGNTNNTNDTRRPGKRGDWTPSYLPDGIQTSKSGGMEYYYENRQKTFEWTSNLNASHSKNHIQTQISGESFLPSDKAFSQGRNDETYRSASVNSTHSFKAKKKARHSGSVSFYYDKNRYASLGLTGEFTDNPYAYVTGGVLDSLFLPGAGTLRQVARYRRSQEVYHKGENWSISAPYSLRWTPFQSKGINDMLFFDLEGSYDKHTSHAFDKYRLEYFGTGGLSPDYRNRYTTKPSRHYNYNTQLAYFMPLKSFWPMLTYRYAQDYRSGRNDLFRLDRIEGWGEGTDHGLGTLPSSASDMQQALDIQNSEHAERWRREHQVEFKLEYRSEKKNQTTVVVFLPVRFEWEHLLYDRSARHYDLHRSKALFTPHGYFKQVFMKGDLSTIFDLNYAMSCQQPDLMNTIELVNDANPLYVQRGNASLRRSTNHKLSLNVSTKRKFIYPLYDFRITYQRTHNALATERTYNPATGGYTVRPVNVDGNWRTDGSLAVNRQFGAQKSFSWGSNTSYSFDHNVDMANVEGTTTNGLSTIRNLYLREQLTLDFSRNGWNIGTKVRGSYNRLTGKRSDFADISAWDYNYGVNARIPLPWGIGLSTDFTVFSRRGYEDPSLNTDDLVWNMRLERSVLHGNLTFALDGFDLLHNLSKVTRVVNAQGRTESFTNVMPSYFMAHVIYRLNKQPKNKKQ